MHTKTRSDSFHSQPQPMRINHSATLPAFRRRVPSMNHIATPRLPSKPVKIQANFHDPPIKELMYVVTVKILPSIFMHNLNIDCSHPSCASNAKAIYVLTQRYYGSSDYGINAQKSSSMRGSGMWIVRRTLVSLPLTPSFVYICLISVYVSHDLAL